MFEHHKQPLATREVFIKRMVKCAALAVVIAGVSLLIGILGYHYFEQLSWIDSLLNASMILSGMGPVVILKTSLGKLFASFYALFSGMVFLVTVGIIIAPIVHRFLHIFHVEGSKSEPAKTAAHKEVRKNTRVIKKDHKHEDHHKHKDEEHRPKTLLDF